MSEHAIHFKFPAFIDFLHLVEIKVTRHYFYLLFLLGIIASHHFIGDLWSLRKKRSGGALQQIFVTLKFEAS